MEMEVLLGIIIYGGVLMTHGTCQFLLNDGTVKLMRTIEELQQLQWHFLSFFCSPVVSFFSHH